MDPKFFKTPEALRVWFEKQHDKLDETWIGYYKKASKKASITWEESVAVALCFGWIDGIRKSIDDERYKIRFTPRRPNSNWSLKNIKTVSELIEKDLMLPEGLAAFEKRKPEKSGIYSFEQKKKTLPREFENRLKTNKQAWNFFHAQSPYYRKSVIHWVMSAKQEKTRLGRLETLISDSEQHQKIKPLRKR